MKRSIGIIVLQIAVALFLLVSGISGLLKSSAGDLAPVIEFLKTAFTNASVATMIVIVLSVCEIVAGCFLLGELLTTDLRITDIILVVIIVLWIANIALVDFITPISGGHAFRSLSGILKYLSTLSSHLMVLGALILVTKKFN
jgi:hypothetical protein